MRSRMLIMLPNVKSLQEEGLAVFKGEAAAMKSELLEGISKKKTEMVNVANQAKLLITAS